MPDFYQPRMFFPTESCFPFDLSFENQLDLRKEKYIWTEENIILMLLEKVCEVYTKDARKLY